MKSLSTMNTCPQSDLSVIIAGNDSTASKREIVISDRTYRILFTAHSPAVRGGLIGRETSQNIGRKNTRTTVELHNDRKAEYTTRMDS
jgi:hypothetical protein